MVNVLHKLLGSVFPFQQKTNMGRILRRCDGHGDHYFCNIEIAVDLTMEGITESSLSPPRSLRVGLYHKMTVYKCSKLLLLAGTVLVVVNTRLDLQKYSTTVEDTLTSNARMGTNATGESVTEAGEMLNISKQQPPAEPDAIGDSVTQASQQATKAAQQHHPEKPKAATETVADGGRQFKDGAKEPEATMGESQAEPVKKRRISMILKLGGELANHLSYFTHAYTRKLAIERDYPSLTIDLIAEHQVERKWKGAFRDATKCFPNLRKINFHGGRWDPEFLEREEQQRTWIGEDQMGLLNVDNRNCAEGQQCWRKAADLLLNLTQQQRLFVSNETIQEPVDANVSMPFLRNWQMTFADEYTDEFFDEVKKFLYFDETACCGSFPEPDETVFHLRNFALEGRGLLGRGFHEMSPNGTATQLLAHLKAGSKVVIVSRFANKPEFYQKYKEAMEAVGLKVRVAPVQSGPHDFCFLMKTKKELIGMATSTYSIWAGLLGEAERAVFYAVNSTHVRKKKPGILKPYTWKHPILQKRIKYEVYPE